MDAGRRFERPEPTVWRLLRAGLGLPWSLLPAIVAGAIAGRLGQGLALAEWWSAGTLLGVLLGLPLARAWWERASRRRYGSARLVPEGVVFDDGLVLAGQLALEEVTDDGVLVCLRGASSVDRWWMARLIPTSSLAESEELVALLSAWDREGHEAPLWLAGQALPLVLSIGAALLLFSVAGLYALEPLFARGRIAAVLAFMATPLLAIDLATWLGPLMGTVVLTGAELRMNEALFEVPTSTLRVSGGWLFAERGPERRTLWIRRAGVERLRARLGPALVEHPTPDAFRQARRRHLVRALALLLSGPLLALLLCAGWFRR